MNQICKPALIYFVIALIMLVVGIILKFDTFNLGAAVSQFISIILCTLILIGLCSVAPEISWIITIIFILCTISFIVSLIMNWIRPNGPMMYGQY